jgi:hypothetical protein
MTPDLVDHRGIGGAFLERVAAHPERTVAAFIERFACVGVRPGLVSPTPRSRLTPSTRPSR